MKARQAALLASGILASIIGYVYWQLSNDQLEGRYGEEGFLTVAWATMLGLVVFGVLATVSRFVLRDDD